MLLSYHHCNYLNVNLSNSCTYFIRDYCCVLKMWKIRSVLSLLLLSLIISVAIADNQNSENEIEFTIDDCTKDVEEGLIHCLAAIPRYKWDHTEQKCIEALYGGCHPTKNNFKQLEQCEKIAQPICKTVDNSI